MQSYLPLAKKLVILRSFVSAYPLEEGFYLLLLIINNQTPVKEDV